MQQSAARFEYCTVACVTLDSSSKPHKLTTVNAMSLHMLRHISPLLISRGPRPRDRPAGGCTVRGVYLYEYATVTNSFVLGLALSVFCPSVTLSRFATRYGRTVGVRRDAFAAIFLKKLNLFFSYGIARKLKTKI